MYADHVPVIAAAMHSKEDAFRRGVMFAVLSARTQFIRVPDQLSEVERDGGKAAALWGWKWSSFDHIDQHGSNLFSCCSDNADPVDVIHQLTRIPGLGIVKAAFVAQMLGHDVACLDTRNIKRLGLNPRAWRTDGEDRKNLPGFRAKVAGADMIPIFRSDRGG